MSEVAEETKITEPLKDFKHIGSWHKKWVIPFGIGSLHIAGMITGCGIAQCYGVSMIDPNKTKEDLLKALSVIKSDGVGAIVCTLGHNFYSKEPSLLNLGFEKLSEYVNYKHSSSYMQRLYILKL